jgi:chaperonin cofactor prefoldin
LISSIDEGIYTTSKLSDSLKKQRDQTHVATNAFNEATKSLELRNSQMKESINSQFDTAQKNLDFYLKDLRVDKI